MSEICKRRHVLTVSLDEYFQGAAFRGVINDRLWNRFEGRAERNAERTLEFLESLGARATFFISSWTAERVPHVIRTVVDAGHEIASAGRAQRSFRGLSETQLRDEARISKIVLENISGRRVLGYRVADHRLGPRDLWALRVLCEEGYSYDSSLSPSLFRFRNDPTRRLLHREEFDGVEFWELPLPAMKVGGMLLPIAGGNYFRQLPEFIVRYGIRNWMRHTSLPFVFYFRAWDLDLEQPEITGAPMSARIRHYRNAEKMPNLLRTSLEPFTLTTASAYLGLEQTDLEPELKHVPMVPQVSLETALDGRSRLPVSVIIPCFNEGTSLHYLRSSLGQLHEAGKQEYEFRYVFVDDGSTDNSWDLLHSTFGNQLPATFVRHEVNRGVSAAIWSGFRAASTEIVCSIDCDCSYDPLELLRIIPMLSEDTACVTASPYHPNGKVLNVPKWRRAVSGAASLCYRVALWTDLNTFTSCFRVYRRSTITELQVRESGFVGVAELLGELILRGYQVKEYPSTLASRMLGHSKMKLFRNSGAHLKMLARFAVRRMTSSAARVSAIERAAYRKG